MSSSLHPLQKLLQNRIVIIDGATGTTIRTYDMKEADIRGTRFRDSKKDLLNNGDIFSLTQPAMMGDIHRRFLEAGADIVETNTFGANAIAAEDYKFAAHIVDLNVAAAQVARRAAERAERADGKPRFVAGSIGPTTKTASLSPDVNDPGFRAITFAQLVAAYREQTQALLDGGVDLLLTETHIDTLNMKASLFAIAELFDGGARRVPVIASVTIPDRSGRTLSGQNIEAFYTSIANHDLFAVSVNCALGAEEMRPHVAELARLHPGRVMCYPNAGLPNEFGGYDDTPASMARVLAGFAEDGLLNLVGGCCGTTPAHIGAIHDAVRPLAARGLGSGVFYREATAA